MQRCLNPGFSERIGNSRRTGDRVTRDSAFEGHDTRVAILQFASGAVGKVSANVACVYPHHHKLTVYGTRATFENGVTGALWFETRDPSVAPARIEADYPGVAKYALIAGSSTRSSGRRRRRCRPRKSSGAPTSAWPSTRPSPAGVP